MLFLLVCIHIGRTVAAQFTELALVQSFPGMAGHMFPQVLNNLVALSTEFALVLVRSRFMSQVDVRRQSM